MRTADVPRQLSLSSSGRSERQLDVLERLPVRVEDVLQQRDVSHRQTQSVNLRQSLLVRKRRHVMAKFVERSVDAHHSTTLAYVRREPK